MTGIRSYLLGSVAAVALFACSPPRPSFDAMIDVSPADVQNDVQSTDGAMDAQDAMADARTDARMDARMDAPADVVTCDAMLCDSACMMAGFPGGVCRMGRCQCIGAEMDAGGRRDAGEDAIVDAGVIGCLTNMDCPPTTFCNGAGCMSVGFCAPRSDPSTCEDASMPVCGCDGMLYMNTCARLAAGVRLDPSGAACRRD